MNIVDSQLIKIHTNSVTVCRKYPPHTVDRLVCILRSQELSLITGWTHLHPDLEHELLCFFPTFGSQYHILYWRGLILDGLHLTILLDGLHFTILLDGLHFTILRFGLDDAIMHGLQQLFVFLRSGLPFVLLFFAGWKVLFIQSFIDCDEWLGLLPLLIGLSLPPVFVEVVGVLGVEGAALAPASLMRFLPGTDNGRPGTVDDRGCRGWWYTPISMLVISRLSVDAVAPSLHNSSINKWI